MIPCIGCGKGHRTPEAVDACILKVKKRDERAKKKAADMQRRQENAAKLGDVAYIREKTLAGIAPTNISAALNREYPPREDGIRWNDILVVEVQAMFLNWPEGPVTPSTEEQVAHDYHPYPLVGARGSDMQGQVICKRCVKNLWGDE